MNCISDQVEQQIWGRRHLPDSFVGSFAAYSSFFLRNMLITLPYYANSERYHEARCSLIAQKLPWKTAEGLLREFKHIYFSKLLKLLHLN